MERSQPGRLRWLDAEQIEAFKRAACEVLMTAGVKVSHAGARELLERAGAIVAGDRVRVPRELVEAAVAAAPGGWTIYDREGRPAMAVRGRNTYFGTSTGAPNMLDARSGRVRPTRCADIAEAARLADALKNIDFVMPFGSAQDIPGAMADLYEFEALLANTAKPLAFLGASGKAVNWPPR